MHWSTHQFYYFELAILFHFIQLAQLGRFNIHNIIHIKYTIWGNDFSANNLLLNRLKVFGMIHFLWKNVATP